MKPALVISDIDGTLVTPDKRLTPEAIAAVRRLEAASIGFTLISSRPPRGMTAIAETLDVRLPLAAFNGGNIVGADGGLLEAHRIAPEVARRTLELLDARGISAWVFTDEDWRLRDPNGPRAPFEQRTVGFDPLVVPNFDDVIDRIDKIVGVSDDHAKLARVRAEARANIGADAVIELSQPYYLDITHPLANKGDAVAALCRRIGVELRWTAVIGDMFNDIAMFEVAGLAIAMGQSPPEVKLKADLVSAANSEDGFAKAVDRFILQRANA